jgi:hypothetical protein
MLTVFDDNDVQYSEWLAKHGKGFVINTRRSCDPGYMVLHRARCFTISQYTSMARRGGFTERQYVKVCADTVHELTQWTKSHGRTDGTFSTECSLCKPT